MNILDELISQALEDGDMAETYVAVDDVDNLVDIWFESSHQFSPLSKDEIRAQIMSESVRVCGSIVRVVGATYWGA